MVLNFTKRIKRGLPAKFFFQLAGIFFLIVMAGLLVADFRMYQKKKELKEQIAAYEKKIEEIKKNTQFLKEQIVNADSEEYLEKIAYEQGMVRAGEKGVVFVAPPEKPQPAEKTENFWSAWILGPWNWIKSKF